jgi:hypothetical protein
MGKYGIGDVVAKDSKSNVIVRAIFTTVDGDLRYAIENDGALEFVEEDRLSPTPKSNVAA